MCYKIKSVGVYNDPSLLLGGGHGFIIGVSGKTCAPSFVSVEGIVNQRLDKGKVKGRVRPPGHSLETADLGPLESHKYICIKKEKKDVKDLTKPRYGLNVHRGQVRLCYRKFPASVICILAVFRTLSCKIETNRYVDR